MRAGSNVTTTGPCELFPARCIAVIFVGTWSRPSPSVSAAAPLGAMSTSTVVGPASVTTSDPPPGSVRVISAVP